MFNYIIKVQPSTLNNEEALLELCNLVRNICEFQVLRINGSTTVILNSENCISEEIQKIQKELLNKYQNP
jgi:hypothetical protein